MHLTLSDKPRENFRIVLPTLSRCVICHDVPSILAFLHEMPFVCVPKIELIYYCLAVEIVVQLGFGSNNGFTTPPARFWSR